ncbi:hypothetical protein CONPUDRAFT_134056 [Coniophora puteana RWD-64-598 SS2]|uniref:Elongator complex protein 5 n=1 Tax=Coniophora puteana (strain RWD-64-598) TaxID=741705 RepID=A0A5M3N5G5_CONPW|nr:uncharacterized protein CONPUDRAFT_134056 [Coniophora puteana RWD-64-598 SS2]EIW86662.1 hypothetical protein CONPUDRAFT_134056 [Coniophora puteana RWD-64-598 SS2]
MQGGQASPDHIRVHDYTSFVPGFSSPKADLENSFLAIVNDANADSLNVVIDSVDTLVSDLESDSKAYKLLCLLFKVITSRSQGGVLILHSLPCTILDMVTQATFSSSLAHVIAHPPELLSHLSSIYMTKYDPSSPNEKFWSLFIPFSRRTYEADKLVYSADGSGSNGGAWCEHWVRGNKVLHREFVLELVIRTEGRRRTIERSLEGWKNDHPTNITNLESLKDLWAYKQLQERPSNDDAAQHLTTFNLNLTPSQEKSRAEVPLPYAHPSQGKSDSATGPSTSTILYDPDSADDIDDDDPDEDLDI